MFYPVMEYASAENLQFQREILRQVVLSRRRVYVRPLSGIAH